MEHENQQVNQPAPAPAAGVKMNSFYSVLYTDFFGLPGQEKFGHEGNFYRSVQIWWDKHLAAAVLRDNFRNSKGIFDPANGYLDEGEEQPCVYNPHTGSKNGYRYAYYRDFTREVLEIGKEKGWLRLPGYDVNDFSPSYSYYMISHLGQVPVFLEFCDPTLAGMTFIVNGRLVVGGVENVLADMAAFPNDYSALHYCADKGCERHVRGGPKGLNPLQMLRNESLEVALKYGNPTMYRAIRTDLKERFNDNLI